MKSVRISDEAYKKIIKRSKKDKRTITATIDIMIDESIANVAAANEAATSNISPYSPIDWGSESDQEVERKPVRGTGVKEMTLEEMAQMQQRMKNKAPNWDVSEEE